MQVCTYYKNYYVLFIKKIDPIGTWHILETKAMGLMYFTILFAQITDVSSLTSFITYYLFTHVGMHDLLRLCITKYFYQDM